VPELVVINKSDLDPERAAELAAQCPGALVVSALTGDNIEQLIATIGDRLRSRDRVLTLHLPAARGDLIAAAHREGEVLTKESVGDEVVVRVVLDVVGAARFEQWAATA